MKQASKPTQRTTDDSCTPTADAQDGDRMSGEIRVTKEEAQHHMADAMRRAVLIGSPPSSLSSQPTGPS